MEKIVKVFIDGSGTTDADRTNIYTGLQTIQSLSNHYTKCFVLLDKFSGSIANADTTKLVSKIQLDNIKNSYYNEADKTINISNNLDICTGYISGGNTMYDGITSNHNWMEIDINSLNNIKIKLKHPVIDQVFTYSIVLLFKFL